MQIPDGPFLLAAHADSSSSTDFLGLRTMNLQMMDDLLPGLNNVAERIRPFSVLAWTIWAYENYCLEHGVGMSARDYAIFREKIEVLFIASHRAAGMSVSGIAGAEQRSGLGAHSILRFKDVGRSDATTLISAQTYGPGLKGENGYGFAYPDEKVSDVFRVTKAGEELAKALDEKLQKMLSPPHYAFLHKFDPTWRTADLGTFAQGWALEAPTARERVQFWARLHPAASTRKLEQSRAASVDLVLAVLEAASSPLSVSAVRIGLASAALPDLPPSVLASRWRWRALQLRQAQRLCIEVLFGAVERYIWQIGAHSSAQFAHAMTGAIASAQPQWNGPTLLADRQTYYAAKADGAEALFARALEDPECDVVSRAAALQTAAGKLTYADGTIAEALDLLLLVAVYVEHFAATPELAQLVANPVAKRLPLDWWATYVRARSAMALRDFLELFVENWLVSQHLGVAAARTRADSTRMRLSIDDKGIGSLLEGENQCWSPVLSADRLYTCLRLMSECDQIERIVGPQNSLLYGRRGARG